MFLDAIIHNLPSVPVLLFYAVILLPALYTLLLALYNLTLHPLSSYPGPLLSRALPLPHALRLLSGRGPFDVLALHEKYGPVVRIGPNHLSYTDVRAWRDIFGAHLACENPKSWLYYRERPIERDDDPPNLLDADLEEHTRLRKALAGGFSEKAMREQEAVILGYVDLLMQGLKKHAEKRERVDMVRWMNWTTFDVVGDLVFAESFGCLEGEESHPFVDAVTGLVDQQAVFLAMKYVGLTRWRVVKWALKQAVVWTGWGRAVEEMQSLMGEKLKRRLEVKEERTDLFEGLMSRREEWNLSMAHLQSNAMLLAAAGSETTASLLAGVTFLLLQNPDRLDKLKREVRSAFRSVADISITSVNRLPYLLACLNEGLRRYPPVLSNLPRDVHQGGEMIAGRYVPDNTMLEVQFWSMNHYSKHWTDPYAFRPERWLNRVAGENGEAREAGEKTTDEDRLEAMQDFSVGPRNCVGRNLAYAEMRLILARLIFEFDMELADECNDWVQRSKGYSVWIKPPLYVHLTAVRR